MTTGVSSLEQVFARSDAMVSRRIADEYILVPIVSRSGDLDAIFDLNKVGAFIWELLDGHRTGREIVAEIAGHFDVEPSRAAQDYQTFIAQLQSIRAVAPAR